jgi:hypothetical protein
LIQDLLGFVDSSGTKVTARMQTKMKRAVQARPKWVCESTVHHTPSENTSAGASPLIAAAVSTSHTAPEPSARTRLNQAMKASFGHSAARTRVSSDAARSAGAATKTAKKTTPAAISVAAKWMART